MNISTQVDNRFQNDAGKYAAYLQTPEGRLRLDLASANLQEFLPAQKESSCGCALDLGCGTGATGIRLARLGLEVTLLDCSQPMLDVAQNAALDAGVGDNIALNYGDITSLRSLFDPGSFDIILCHNVVEYVDDPGAVLCDAGRLLRNPSGILSVVVRSQAGEVLKAAIQTGDLAAADRALTAEWGQESLYGGGVRVFTLENLRSLMRKASLSIVAERGVRIVTDYLPQQISRAEEYERIFELERKLSSRAEFVAVARYVQIVARST